MRVFSKSLSYVHYTLHLLFSILEERKSTFELPLGDLNVLKFIVVSDTSADKENHSHQGCCRAMVVVCLLLCFHGVLTEQMRLCILSMSLCHHRISISFDCFWTCENLSEA